MKKKRSLVVFTTILALSFLLSGCQGTGTAPTDANATTSPAIAASSSPASAESTTTSPTESTSADSTGKLKLTMPAGWTKVEGSVLDYQYMKNTASFMVKTENFSSDDLGDVVTEAEDNFKSSFDGFTRVSTKDIKVAGIDAKQLTFTAKVSGLSMKYMYVYFISGNKTYAITFGDVGSSFNKLSNDFDKILDSMTIS